MSLTTPPKVEKLQKALHAKAKAEPEFRFYQLYDKVYRADILAHAYRLCRANGGASGVDGVRFEDIESKGLRDWLGELTQELRERRYQPSAVRRVWIPKANGGQRPLGIPTIRDRVVQTAAMLVLEPIFEADLQPEQYAYRRGRSALDAVRAVHKLVNTGHEEVIEGDLSGYFDSHRLRQWLCDKHKRPGRGTGQYPDQFLYDTLGLVRLTQRTRDLPWAKA